MGDAQNCAETALNCAESDLGPDFIGTLVRNFGFGNRSVHDGCDRQKEPNVFLVQVPATEDNDNSWLSAPHGTKITSLIHRCRPSALRTRPHHSCRSFTPPIELGQLGRLHLDRRIDFSAISVGMLLQLIVAEIHT